MSPKNIQKLLEEAAQYRKKKQYEKAIEPLRKAIQLKPDKDTVETLAQMLRNAGIAKSFDRQFEKSKKYYSEAEEIYKELDNPAEIFKIKMAIGRCESSLCNYNESILIFKKLLSLLMKTGYSKLISEGSVDVKESTGKIMYYISIAYAKNGKWLEALKFIKAAKHRSYDDYRIGLCEQGEGIISLELGLCKTAVFHLNNAKEYFTDDSYKTANINENIARCLHKLGKYRKAIYLFDLAIAAYEKMGYERAWAYFYRGLSFEALKELKKANKDYLQAVDIVEKSRGEIKTDFFRQTYFAQKLKIYETAVLNSIELGELEQSYDLVQRAKSRGFNEKIETGFKPNPKVGRFWAELQKLKTQINDEYSKTEYVRQSQLENLKYLENKYDRLLLKMKEFNDGAADIILTSSMPLKEIQKLLALGTALIEYYVTEDKLLIYCITKNGFQIKAVPVSKADIQKISENIKLWILNMEQAGGKERDAIKAGFDWYVEKISATIFKPVEEFLKEIDRLIIVPHLSLHYLPFSALINTEGRRLIEKYEIVNLPSPRLLKKTGKTVTLSKLNALIIGNPLGDLKYAGKEARIISKILLNSKLLSGKNANKAAILKLLPDYSILHFACHARIDYDKPLFSGLIVSDGKGCKARIELNEILEIKNKADLVVLSGCETSGGNITPGDEITCFPRAFMYSGASSLLVSLWEIDDNSTSEFMKYFYTELYVNGKTKSEALEMAQLQMVEAGYSPYHWSGFQLVGT